FRVGYNSQGGDPSTVSIDRSTFDGNSVDVDAGNAAGLYLEDLTLTMTATTISNNTGHYGGGLWAGHNITANLTNVTIADNTASGGGGIWFSDLTKGTFQNVTIAGNTGDGLFNGDTNTVLQDSIIANNVRGTLDSTTNCASAHGSNGANLQFPNDGKTSCTSDITFGDPTLGPLADNGGPVKTMLPASGSAAIGKGVSCAATDATGAIRPSACTLGAVEAK
ncbi:MAG: choice-of-anchor Q domain-containing protein, partial [Polyangiaceae bacterium]